MSQTTSPLNLKGHYLNTLRRRAGLYLKDLSFIPEDKLTSSPGGCARNPLDFTAECAGFNRLVAALLRGEQAAYDSDSHAKTAAAITSFEIAKAELEASVEALAQTVESLSDEALGEAVTTPWGMETTRFGLAEIASEHITYHDGQLNYIQSLYGDGEVHWG